MFKKAGKRIFALLLIAGIAVLGGKVYTKVQQSTQKSVSIAAAAGDLAADALQNLSEMGETISEQVTDTHVTFLLTGIDSALGGSDVIMLASLDLETGSVRVLQIPRDTFVNRQGSTSHKINAIYSSAAAKARKTGKSADEAAEAGNRALRAFLETSFGITIDHYISVNTEGLRKIVDAVGGVDLTVPQDLNYDDESQDLHIHLKKGKQHLDGSGAEQFVRYRSGYQTADYGRMDAQKIFLSAFFHKIKTEFTLPTLIKLSSACIAYTDSDLSAADLVPLIRAAIQVSEENVKMITLKGQAVKDENGVLCEVLSRSYAIDLICDYLLPRGGKASELSFDPNGVFTAPGEIDKIYRGDAPFGKNGVSADETETLRIR